MRLLKKNSGFSLIELMISLAIGLIIILALGQLYQTANKSERQTNEMLSIYDKLNIFSKIINSNITNAGYVDLFDGDALSSSNGNFLLNEVDIYKQSDKTDKTPIQVIHNNSFPISVCKGSFEANPSLSAEPECVKSGNNDSFQFSFQAAIPGASNVNKSLQSSEQYYDQYMGSGLDCLGSKITENSGFVINRFNLENNTLYCKSSIATTKQPILDNVSQIVFSYHILTDKKISGKENLYQTKVISPSNILDATINPRGYAGIIGVNICLVVFSENNMRSIDASTIQAEIPNCDGNSEKRSSTDRRVYRLINLDYALPNAIYNTSWE